MPLISNLLQRLPAVKDVHMSSTGLALWIAWESNLDNAVPQTLQDYGGLCVATDRDQSLWFFFSPDVFLALARLVIWAKFNTLKVSIQVIPARLLLSVRRDVSLAIDSSLTNQEVVVPQTLKIWVHKKSREQAGNLPGITFAKTTQLKGMAAQDWEELEADQRLPYTSSQGWYALLRPLGNPLDKKFQTGWRFMYAGIEALVQRLKLKYNVYDNYVMLPLDNLRLLRTFMRDLIQFLASVKGNPDYWPCVCVIVDRKGLNFNNELPSKVGIKWASLMPDFPYMSYRNAFLLGEGFQITDLHFSSSHSSMDSWCTVGQGEGLSEAIGSIPVLVSGQLLTGSTTCFYCGQHNHESNQCPTRRMRLSSGNMWQSFEDFSLDAINEGFRNIDTELVERGVAGYAKILESSGPQNRMLRMIFEINVPCQLRIVERIWLSTGRDFPNTNEDFELTKTKDTITKDDNPIWSLLDRFTKLSTPDLGSFEKEIQSAMARSPRDHRFQGLLGFVTMERCEYSKAHAAWKEAEAMASSGLLQFWYQFLQARALEIQSKLSEALDIYQTVIRLAPQWREAEYRQIVCRVKMGFTEQVQPRIVQMAEQEPQTFNRYIIDPELERGHLIILTALYSLWADSKRLAEEEKAHIERLMTQVDDWFNPENVGANRLRQRLIALTESSSIENYLSFLSITRTRPAIEKDLATQIQQEIEDLKARFKTYLSVLEIIRDEAAWFPFPRVLVEFNHDFNECAGIINWAFGANFYEAEFFKRAQGYVPTIVDLLTKLERRLRFLRIVRDSTLYVLILGRTFFWVEIIGLFLCLTIIPTIAIFGSDFGMGWLKTMIRNSQWELQKVVLIIISIASLGIAALRTTLIFEKRRDQLLADAKTQREQVQKLRLERIKEAMRQKEAKKKKVKPEPIAKLDEE